MADSFMIRIATGGKPCYANVYVFDTVPKQFHVHIVNPQLCPGLPPTLKLVQKGQKLVLLEPQQVSQDIVRSIEDEIFSPRP